MLQIYREIYPNYDPAALGTHLFATLNADAGPDWITRAVAAGLQISSEPREGSVLVTGAPGYDGHVAVVERYDENTGLWMVSESGWETLPAWVYHNSLYESDGHWYSSYATYPDVIGFILIPGVTPGPTPPPTPHPSAKWIYYMKNWNNEVF